MASAHKHKKRKKERKNKRKTKRKEKKETKEKPTLAMIRTWEKRNRGGGEGRGEKLSRGAARGEERIYGRVVVVVRRSLNVGGAVVVEDDERRRRKVGRDVPSLVTWHSVEDVVALSVVVANTPVPFGPNPA